MHGWMPAKEEEGKVRVRKLKKEGEKEKLCILVEEWFYLRSALRRPLFTLPASPTTSTIIEDAIFDVLAPSPLLQSSSLVHLSFYFLFWTTVVVAASTPSLSSTSPAMLITIVVVVVEA